MCASISGTAPWPAAGRAGRCTWPAASAGWPPGTGRHLGCRQTGVVRSTAASTGVGRALAGSADAGLLPAPSICSHRKAQTPVAHATHQAQSSKRPARAGAAPAGPRPRARQQHALHSRHTPAGTAARLARAPKRSGARLPCGQRMPSVGPAAPRPLPLRFLNALQAPRAPAHAAGARQPAHCRLRGRGPDEHGRCMQRLGAAAGRT